MWTIHHYLHQWSITLSSCCECHMGPPRFVHKLCATTRRYALPNELHWCCGNTNGNTGLSEIMQNSFWWCPKDTHSHEMSIVNDKANKSRTANLWTDNLIKPVFIMVIFVRAEREADWPLHLWAVEEMLPYFFASSHCNYARFDC